ncbi:MAG UNVERIFIED_CONTAM: UbiA family prenyltransferase [Rickettsiaceae bacterium]
MSVSNKFLDFLLLIRFWAPTGYILLFLPCAIGLGLYSNIYESYGLIVLFFMGSMIMRSAGCIINDIWDRDIDKNVARTKLRPIASGAISIKEALIFCCVLSLFGLIILLQLSKNAILIGLFSSILVVIYPLMKRITFWPQFFLGITFNIGLLIAVAHLKYTITIPAIITYLGLIFWTLYYDTIYAFMDLEDDKKTGVKSLAIFIEGDCHKLWLVFFAVTALILVMIGLWMTDHNIKIIALATIISIVVIMWQIITLKINLPLNCLIRFKSNNYLGIIWAMASII